MKKFIALVAVFIFAASTAFSQSKAARQSKSKGAEQQLIQFMKNWADIYGRRNSAAIRRILPDDFTLNDCNGGVQSKAEYLEMIKNTPSEFIVKDTEQKVRVFEKTAIITARYTFQIESISQPAASFRYMTVFVNRRGQWMPVAFQTVCASDNPL